MLNQDQIKQNIDALEQQGAKPDEIQGWLDSLKTTQAPPPQGFWGKAAGLINKGVGAVTNAIDATGIPKVVGGAVGALGAVAGAATGGLGQAAIEAYKGVTGKSQGIGQAAINIDQAAQKNAGIMAGHGYDIGHAGAESAPLGVVGKLGVVGRVANLGIAYGQGYQGASDIISGVKENDPTKIVQGTTEAGMAAMGAYSGAKGMGGAISDVKNTGWKAMLIDPQTVNDIKDFSKARKVNALKKIEVARTGAANELWRLTQPEIKREMVNGKDVISGLVNEGVTSETYKDASGVTRLSNKPAIDELKPRRDAANDALQEKFTSNPKTLSYQELRAKAIADFKSYNSNMAAATIEDGVAEINKIMDAEIRRNASNQGIDLSPKQYADMHTNYDKVDAKNVDSTQFNDSKKGFWSLSSFSGQDKRTLTQKVAFTLGKTAQGMLENSYKGEADIQGLNQQVGKYSDMIHFLQASEGRSVPKGSALSGLTRKAVGTLAGSIAGHAIPIPVVGPAIGAYVGEKAGAAMTPTPGAKLQNLNVKQKILQNKLNK